MQRAARGRKSSRVPFKQQIKEAQAELAAEEASMLEDFVGTVEVPAVRPEPVRPTMREDMREEDPRTRAARRAQELRDHGNLDTDGEDRFYIDLASIPPGWDYEWKRKTVAGAEDPAYTVALARGGWEAVPAKRHPDMMPLGGHHAVIERSGMVLMERPSEINEEAKHREYMKARKQVGDKETQLGQAPQGQFERMNKHESLAKVNRTYEHIPIPKD